MNSNAHPATDRQSPRAELARAKGHAFWDAVRPTRTTPWVKSTSGWFKHLLTRIGPRLSHRRLEQIQGVVNYLRVGKWMEEHHFMIPEPVRDRLAVWDVIADRAGQRQVLYLEFGVAGGRSMEYWSSRLTHPGAILHGFDSFEGLPENGGPWSKGQFGTDGAIPQVEDPRVRFFKGWFDHTLPIYSPPPHEMLIVNLDADLYSSTICVLRCLRPYIRPGTVIYFDEMNWVEHEPRAFDDFMAETGIGFRLLSADKTLAFVAFECVSGNGR
jgi:hypothetical protein